MTIRVFRSHKGDIEKGIRGSLVLRNPQHRPARARSRLFAAKDSTIDQLHIPRKLPDSDGQADRPVRRPGARRPAGNRIAVPRRSGSTSAWPRPTSTCELATPRSPCNFVKGYLGIWVQMLLVTGFGVMFSTFLERAGGDAGHAGRAGDGLLHASSSSAWRSGHDRRRRPGRIVRSASIKQHERDHAARAGLTTDVVKAADGVFMYFMTP